MTHHNCDYVVKDVEENLILIVSKSMNQYAKKSSKRNENNLMSSNTVLSAINKRN
jgi:hypothetical protein